MTQLSLWDYEAELLAAGRGPICGVDEAGRGPLAGPVCAAAVMLPPGLEIPGLNEVAKIQLEEQRALEAERAAEAARAAEAELQQQGEDLYN